ncbi:cytochrome p450 [Moniliophthora roreri]|uniref:Putative cytochrome P450 n=1 Tax=Moniliophthora roreri TaxID=221103 RepID=A0A0W0FIV9_MONRR|nr:cytochrome p450 [Moniliophthora roreri]
MGIFIILGSVLGCYLAFKLVKEFLRSPLPPGPMKLPLLGNVLNGVPPHPQWAHFKEWSRNYNSDIISIKFFDTVVIIVNSVADAQELFLRRGQVYSNRPVVPMVELMDFGWSFPFHQYGTEQWKAGRRLFHQEFDVNRPLIHPIETTAALSLVKRLLDDPHNLEKRIRHMAGDVILSTAYGIDVLPENDPNIQHADDVIKDLATAFNPASYLVNLLPSLQYIPEWFPGAGWKIKLKAWRKASSELRNAPFEELKERVANGTTKPCVGSRLLADIRERGDDPQELDVLSSMLGTMFGAGSDTTVSALLTCILGMLLYPEAQRKAQAALDSVTQGKRFPSFHDRENLPYIEACVKEALRWNPVGPLAAPHVTSQDDYYKGYLIPKGSVVLGNSHAILRDEAVYGPDVDAFRPDRFLNEDGTLKKGMDSEAAFGYGRRICPGRNMARDSIFITIAYLLFSYEFSVIEGDAPMAEYTSGLTVFPLPYRCKITPRSEEIKALIRDL